MRSAFVRTARERYTVRHLLAFVVLIALLYGVTRNGGMVLGFVVAVTVAEVATLLRETPGIDSRWVGVGVGTFVTLASISWFAYEYAVVPEADGPVWFPLLTALAGLWIVLDARRDFVEGRGRDDSRDDPSANEAMLVMSHAHLVVDELRSGPKTVDELADACDLTESRVREALDVATHDGMVYGVSDDAGRYALDESKTGGVAFVRSNATRIAQRLVRPFHR